MPSPGNPTEANYVAAATAVLNAKSARLEAVIAAGKARDLAGMSLWQFRQLIASRQIEPHYDLADLEEDMAILRELVRP